MVVSRSMWVIGIAAACAAVFGCAAKSSGGGGASGTSGGAGGSTGNDTAAVGSDLTILFSPMYSGYDDGMHTFKIPAVVLGIAGVKWSASDRSFVDLEDDPSTGGVMITTRKAGDVKIIARLGTTASGSADLHITHFGPDDCKLGGDRYNNQVIVAAGANGLPAGGLSIPENASCANCHGSGAMFLDVQHTPQQTGGYADMDLINIFSQGYKPNGSMFHTMIPPQIYQRFHTWDATDPEKTGLVCYLRSLDPMTQGMIDFGGRGMGMGMGMGRMGGGGAPGGGAGAPGGGGGAPGGSGGAPGGSGGAPGGSGGAGGASAAGGGGTAGH